MAAAETDWDDFKAFNDTLSAGILRHSPEGLANDVLQFYNWLQGLLANPTAYGIPARYISNVTTLFDRFLEITPSSKPQSSNKGSVSLVTVCERTNDAGEDEIDPIIVTFGPNDAVLKIADGATALGYLFSLVEPPSNANWRNYWFPLCLVFSRCIYLAFVKDSSSHFQKLSGVPVMVSVMYLAGQTQLSAVASQPFMFGATMPSKPYHDDTSIKKKQDETRNRASNFRRAEVLSEELRAHSPVAALPLDESDLWTLSSRLHLLFVGTSETWANEFRVSLPEVEKEGSGRQEKAFKRSGKVEWVPVPPKSLLTRRATKVLLLPKLHALIRLRWAITGTVGSVEKDPNIKAAIQDLLEFYLTPRIYSKSSPYVPFAPDEGEAGSIQAFIARWWLRGDYRAAAYAKLQYLVDSFDKHHDPASKSRSGLCAETYPVLDVRSKFFPASLSKIQNIRGLAMEPRGIGNTDYFDIYGISLSTVREIPGWNGHTKKTDKDRHVCRYPCTNCEKLLPKFGIAAQRTGVPPRSDYDKDMEEARVNAQ